MSRTILMIDDSVLELDMLSELLGDEYITLVAKSGEEGLATLSRSYKSISAVLLDILMPGMDGFEVLKRIRANVQWRRIPVIVTTGLTEEAAQERAFFCGANAFVTKPFNRVILKQVLHNTVTLCEMSAIANTQRRDTLTGLLNREAFFAEAVRMIAHHEPGYYVLSCLDVDSFKLINDQYGTEKGDGVLQHIARCIDRCVSRISGLCCRFMADKFAILYPTEYRESLIILGTHKETVSPPCISRTIKVRIGRYLINDVTLPVSSMFDRATLAAESIKGRYDVYISQYDESMRDSLLNEQRIVNEMNEALATGQFEPWFQPQYNHSTGALIGAEALVRWRHPTSGILIPPDGFIPVFERNGFIYDLDKYIWRQVCIQLRKWLDTGRKPPPVSVNISRRDVYHKDFFDYITGLLQEYRLPIGLLRLEITESAFAESSKTVIGIINKLIDNGFTVEIDDFGSGYSSLNTLKDVQASILKLDMKFFEDTGNLQRSGNIVESVVRMARWLGMAVIAEGVETIEQADYLKSIGCNYIQGYLYSKPISLSEYEKLCATAEKEPKLSRLKTVDTWDNGAFWNPKSMETLIFNSYVGGACIFEYHDGSMELLRVNEQYGQELGYFSPKNSRLTDQSAYNHLDEDNQKKMIENILTAIETQRESSCELVLTSPGEPERTEYIRSTVRVIARAGDRFLLYCVILNLTKQRLIEKKESENAQQLQIIMGNISGGVSAILIDDDGRSELVFYNEKYYELYGYTKEQALAEGLDVMKLILPEDHEQVVKSVRKLKSDRIPAVIDYRCRKRDGQLVYLRANASLMKIGDRDDVIASVVTDITMLHEAEKREKEAAEKLNTVIRHVGSGIVAIAVRNSGCEILFANDKFYDLFGYSKEEFSQGKTNDFIPLIHPDDRKKAGALIKNARRYKKSMSIEFRVVKPNNRIAWLSANMNVISLSGVDAPVYVTVFTDVTATKESDEQLRFLNTLAHDILAQPDSSLAINDALKKLMNYFGGDRAYVIELDYPLSLSSNTYEVCAKGVSSQIGNLQSIPFDQSSFWYRSLKNNSYIVIESVEDLDDSDDELRRMLCSQDIHALIIASIWRDGSLIGFIGIDNPKKAQNHFDRLIALGDYIAILLTRRDLSDKIRRDYDEMRLLMRDMPGAYCCLELRPGFTPSLVYFNDVLCNMLGMTRAEVVDTYADDAYSFIDPEDVALFTKSAAVHAFDGSQFSIGCRMVKKGGERQFVLIFGRFVKAESDRYRLNLYFTNITDPVKEHEPHDSAAHGETATGSRESVSSPDDLAHGDEESRPLPHSVAGDIVDLFGIGSDLAQRREAHAQLRLLTESIPGGLATYACTPGNVQLVYCNGGLCELFGVTREQFEAKTQENVFAFVFEEDKNALITQYSLLIKHDAPIDCVYRIHTGDGGYKWIHHRAIISDRRDNKLYVSSVMFDITERQEAQEKLRVSEEENRLAIAHSGNIFAKYDIRSRTLSLPATLSPIFELPSVLNNLPEEQIALGRVSQETAKAYARMFEDIARGSKSGTATFQQHSTKGWRWLEAQYTTILSSTGEPVSAVITFSDITERLEKEVVYSKWQQSLNERPDDSYTLFRCNLSKNSSFESREGSLLNVQFSDDGKSFGERTKEYVEQCVYKPDRGRYQTFLNSDTLLANYYRGHRSDVLEYREINTDGEIRWLRLSVDLVEYPNSKDIEVYLMFENIDDTKKNELLMLQRSETDPLTGILNRAAFKTHLEHTLGLSMPDEQHALFLLDIDDFKYVNDTFGHGAGDYVLTELTKRISSMLRYDDLIGRLGGDEFFVFLKRVPSVAAVASKARQICSLNIKVSDSDFLVTVSIGIAMIPQDGSDFETLYQKADDALYQRKKHGKGGYLFVT